MRALENILSFLEYFTKSIPRLLEMTLQHIGMVALGILLALVVGIPLGILCTKSKTYERIILAVANMIQVVPSLALLATLMLFMGLGYQTVVVGLFLYSLLPIIRNTFVGLKEVEQSYLEAGEGMGMTKLQLLFKVKFPLSLPFMVAGLRVATVIAIGVATLAPFIGGEGLGREILSGINVRNTDKILAGAIVAAILAVVVDYALGKLQRRLEVK